MSDDSGDVQPPELSRRILNIGMLRNLVRRRRGKPATEQTGSTSYALEGVSTPPTSIHADSPQDYRQSIASDCSSLMLYSPLQPTEELAVELAVSEWREWQPSTFEDLFVFDNDRRDEKEDDAVYEDMLSDSDTIKRSQVPQHIKVWVPSRTQLSFQLFWWGYKIYLPPPVLAVLNDKRLEAAKRAAIMTGALQWLVGHIPTHTLPPQFQPFLALLSRLPSLTGQLGALLAWSWTAIQTFDKGYGVILTATWVLPIILIPSTWRPAPGDLQSDSPISTQLHSN